MFESMNQDGRQNAMMYFMSLLVSLLVHAAILCVFAVLPLVFFSALHADELVTILIDPPSPSILHPTPVLQAKVSAAAKNIVTYGSIDPVPDHIPVGIPPAEDTPMAIGIDRVIQAIGDPARRTDNRSGIGDWLAMIEPPKLPPLEPPSGRKIIRPGGNIQVSKIIFKVDPVYPEIARRTHVSGAVVLETIIDEEGNVSEVKVLSGHPFLTEAAVHAFKQWKYSPTVLNGEPISVLATVTVIFQLR